MSWSRLRLGNENEVSIAFFNTRRCTDLQSNITCNIILIISANFVFSVKHGGWCDNVEMVVFRQISTSNFSLSEFSHPLLVCIRIDSVCSFEPAAVASGNARSAKCLMHYITGISQPFLTTCDLFPHVRHVCYLVFNYTTRY